MLFRYIKSLTLLFIKTPTKYNVVKACNNLKDEKSIDDLNISIQMYGSESHSGSMGNEYGQSTFIGKWIICKQYKMYGLRRKQIKHQLSILAVDKWIDHTTSFPGFGSGRICDKWIELRNKRWSSIAKIVATVITMLITFFKFHIS